MAREKTLKKEIALKKPITIYPEDYQYCLEQSRNVEGFTGENFSGYVRLLIQRDRKKKK